jgi:hypothetical protein
MQCTPIRKFWDADVPGTCPLTPMMSLFGAGIPHFIIELGILLCPLFEIWKLHLPWRRKLAVAVMFTAGIAVCISALMTIVHTLALDKKMNKDLTWDGLEDQIWAVCDVNLASLASKYARVYQRPLLIISQRHCPSSAPSSVHSGVSSAR